LKADVARAGYEAALAIRPGTSSRCWGSPGSTFAGDDTAAIAALRTAVAITPRPETPVSCRPEAERILAAAADAATIRVIEQPAGIGAAVDRQIAGFDSITETRPRSLRPAGRGRADPPGCGGARPRGLGGVPPGDLPTASALNRALGSGSVDADPVAHAGASDRGR
jgi:hypothetical protein